MPHEALHIIESASPEAVVLQFTKNHLKQLIDLCESNRDALSHLSPDVAYRVFWLNVRTGFGSLEYFYNPLFMYLFGRPPLPARWEIQKPEPRGQCREDDLLWDKLLYDTGTEKYKVKEPLARVAKEIPDHAGEFPATIPNLLNRVE